MGQKVAHRDAVVLASSHSDDLEAAIAPLVAEVGFELVTLEAVASSHTLRLFIDHPAGPAEADRGGVQGGISVEHCAAVSRRVSDWLDAEVAPADAGRPDLVAGSAADADTADERRPPAFWRHTDYTLEVSSPGLDRPLCRPAHFQRFVGAEVALQTHTPVGDGSSRRITGRLAAAADNADGDITLETEAGAFQIAYPRITRARLVPDLGPHAAKEPRRGR